MHVFRLENVYFVDTDFIFSSKKFVVDVRKVKHEEIGFVEERQGDDEFGVFHKEPPVGHCVFLRCGKYLQAPKGMKFFAKEK